mgnify:CR=1 FL=1
MSLPQQVKTYINKKQSHGEARQLEVMAEQTQPTAKQLSSRQHETNRRQNRLNTRPTPGEKWYPKNKERGTFKTGMFIKQRIFNNENFVCCHIDQ